MYPSITLAVAAPAPPASKLWPLFVVKSLTRVLFALSKFSAVLSPILETMVFLNFDCAIDSSIIACDGILCDF